LSLGRRNEQLGEDLVIEADFELLNFGRLLHKQSGSVAEFC
jgi:hypothetical protein